jgi:hypothetical protein
MNRFWTAAWAVTNRCACPVDLSRLIPFGLQENINHFAILVNGPPKVMLLAVDLQYLFG